MQNDNLQFDDFKIRSRTIPGQSESPAMIQFLMKKGIVKNEETALHVLFSLIGLLIVATVFVIYLNFFKTTAVPPLTVEQELLFSPQIKN